MFPRISMHTPVTQSTSSVTRQLCDAHPQFFICEMRIIIGLSRDTVLTVLGLCCCVGFSLVVVNGGYSSLRCMVSGE